MKTTRDNLISSFNSNKNSVDANVKVSHAHVARTIVTPDRRGASHAAGWAGKILTTACRAMRHNYPRF